jgi:hypothetical protein
MTHPCAGHPCDHCYLCDIVGVCCQTVAGTAPATPAVVRIDPDEALRQAILAERGSRVDLAALVRAEALGVHQPRAALPPAATALPPPASALPPAVEAMPQPVFAHLRGGSR